MINALTKRFPRLPDFIALARFDRPIGIWLLLWPTLWAVYIAGDGRPAGHIVFIFVLGVALMRAAGCVINDWADRDVDGHVWRTQSRPVATGKITPTEALIFCAVLLALAASLLLFLNFQTFVWAFGAVTIAAVYPFMKRFTYLPQVVLGAAFSWGIPMAFVAQDKTPGPECWLIFAGNLCWTVAYDTWYAMADREDDIKAGIKSTAILFGEMDLMMIGSLNVMFLLALWMLGARLGLAWPFTLSIFATVGLMAWQFLHARHRESQKCLNAFLHNHWVGGVVFAGIFLGYLFQLTAPPL